MQWKLLFRALGEVLGLVSLVILLFTLLIWTAVTIGIFVLPVALLLIIVFVMTSDRYDRLKRKIN